MNHVYKFIDALPFEEKNVLRTERVDYKCLSMLVASQSEFWIKWLWMIVVGDSSALQNLQGLAALANLANNPGDASVCPAWAIVYTALALCYLFCESSPSTWHSFNSSFSNFVCPQSCRAFMYPFMVLVAWKVGFVQSVIDGSFVCSNFFFLWHYFRPLAVCVKCERNLFSVSLL